MSRAARTIGLVCAAVLGIGLVSVAALGLTAPRENGGNPALTVTQRGPVAGLYPGRSTRLSVEVRNGSRKALRLQRVDARLKRAVPGCPTSALHLGRARTDQVLRPGRTVVVRLPIALDRTAPDGCQGRRVALALRATARPVR